MMAIEVYACAGGKCKGAPAAAGAVADVDVVDVDVIDGEDTDDGKNDGNGAEKKGKKADLSTPRPPPPGFAFRFTYNGVVMTQRLPGCEKTGDMCPAEVVYKQFKDSLFPSNAECSVYYKKYAAAAAYKAAHPHSR
jgi:hypothetical protein